jgi:hypothetical protein
MTRAYDDSTSRCKTCTYFEPVKDVLPPGFGYCNYQSVPAWVHKHLVPRDDHRVMAAVDGLDCWLHAKRGVTLPEGAVDRAVMRVMRNHPLKEEDSQGPTPGAE